MVQPAGGHSGQVLLRLAARHSPQVALVGVRVYLGQLLLPSQAQLNVAGRSFTRFTTNPVLAS